MKQRNDEEEMQKKTKKQTGERKQIPIINLSRNNI